MNVSFTRTLSARAAHTMSTSLGSAVVSDTPPAASRRVTSQVPSPWSKQSPTSNISSSSTSISVLWLCAPSDRVKRTAIERGGRNSSVCTFPHSWQRTRRSTPCPRSTERSTSCSSCWPQSEQAAIFATSSASPSSSASVMHRAGRAPHFNSMPDAVQSLCLIGAQRRYQPDQVQVLLAGWNLVRKRLPRR